MRKVIPLLFAAAALTLAAFMTSPPRTPDTSSTGSRPGAAEPAARITEATPPAGAPQSLPQPACTPASLEQRAAQTLVLGVPGVTTAQDPLVQELIQMGVGGILLQKQNVQSQEQVTALIGGVRAATPVPPLFAADEESGRVSAFRTILGSTSSARTMGATQSPEQIRAFAQQVGQVLNGLGLDLNLAPVVDLDDGDPNKIVGDRSFSANPQITTAAALAYSQGMLDSGVLPAVKHFPGHGRTDIDSHTQPSAVDVTLDELLVTDLVPFADQIDAGVPVVLTSHVGYSALDPALPASLNPRTYQLLRDMGFQGVAMTDSLGMGAITTQYLVQDAAVSAMIAGADALLYTDGREAQLLRDSLVRAVQQGRLPESRLDEAAARMLVLKGLDPSLLTCTRPAPPAMLASLAGTESS
jgi:beta-N-acetylhexosaminidase